MLGRGNQAYQYDTLPIDLEFDQMKPGDLIFYSAQYYKPKHIQKHDMVHIEVYLGGTKSIGSRTCINEVSYHDDFKFATTSYHSIKYHYKSLDTWLDGICRSWCNDHAWNVSKYAVGEGNGAQLVMHFLNKYGMDEI